MVWIHGGAFAVGSAFIYDGSPLAAYEDVVIVVIQYRLGILGFLSTGDEHLRGNWGMLDQVAALEWVQENIESFGGDPGSVTIFGESAGAISVSLHIISPLSSGLFHRAISESGSALIGGTVNPDPKALAQIIANMSGCDTDDSWKIADCLKKRSEEEILNLTSSTKVYLAPVVDGVFLPRDPELLFEAKKISPVSYLLGVTNHEFGWLLAKLFNPPGWEEGMDRETSMSALRALRLFEEDDHLQRAIEEYMGDTQDKIEIRDLHLELMSDVFMVVPTVREARFHRDVGNSVFLYEFQHRPSMFATRRPEFVKSDHGDEIGFVFGAAFWNGDVVLLGNVTEEEIVLSRTMMTYWANFAKKGDPNGDGLIFWPPYGPQESYMQLSLTPEVGTKLKEHRVKFFTETLKQRDGKWSEQKTTEGGDYLDPIVRIEDGLVRGKQLEVEGSPRAVFGYLGIPFAAPPVGPLRFAPPQRPEPWRGIRNATSYPPMCLQKVRRSLFPISTPSSEDCLYLSVYSPVHPAHQYSPLPVMVWIHGGAFILGRGSLFHGTALAGYGNVVVVVIQYRISVAGFLSTGDKWARGNSGFLDQVAAMQWVQRNIPVFGGNPGSVTLFGESVGALSVSLHALSPLSTGLFHKAILQSGSALMPGLLPPLSTQLAYEAAEIAGCSNTQSQLLLHCLRNKTEEEMSQIITSVNELYQLIPVVVDGHFLPDDPQTMFRDGMFRKIPYLVGVTTEEAVRSLVHPETIIPPSWEAGITREQIMEKINTYLTPIFGEEEGGLIFEEYFKDVHDPVTLKERYLDMFGDLFIAIPTLRAAQYYKDAGNPVFLYEFQHRASFYKTRIPQFTRAPHGAELTFVFGGPFNRAFDVLLGNMTEEEKNLSKTVMLYWAKFAWSGNPNRNDLPVWPMNGDCEEYVQFNLTLQIGKRLKKEKLKFWSNKLPRKVAKILI